MAVHVYAEVKIHVVEVERRRDLGGDCLSGLLVLDRGLLDVRRLNGLLMGFCRPECILLWAVSLGRTAL